MKQMQLGDGAYATINRDFKGQIILTANHHDEEQATDTIHLDPASFEILRYFVRRESQLG